VDAFGTRGPHRYPARSCTTPTTGDHSDSDGDRAERTETEHEQRATRADAASVLRGLADGIDAGTVSTGADEDAVTVAVPKEFDLEAEYDRGTDEAEIEVELEWPTAVEGEAGEVAEEKAGETAEVDESADAATDAGGETHPAAQPAVETATVARAANRPASSDGESGEAIAADDEAATEVDASDGDVVSDAAAAEPLVAAAAPLERLARFELFRDRALEWRWRLVHRNGNVIASSGEGYTRKHNARKGLASVMRNAPDADVVDEDRD